MILGWGIRLKYQQSLEGVGQNECVSYWLLLTIMTRHNREQAMSRDASERGDVLLHTRQACSVRPGAIRWLETKSQRFGGLAARDKNKT